VCDPDFLFNRLEALRWNRFESQLIVVSKTGNINMVRFKESTVRKRSRLTPIRDGKALSTIVATIIIVAIAIGVALAVGLWSTGYIESLFKVEKVQLLLETNVGEQANTYKITVIINNVGTRDTVIDGIYLNGKRFWEADVSRVSFYIEGVNQTLPLQFSLPIGKKATMEIYLGSSFYHNQLVEVKLHTVAGNEVIQTAYLP